jgi:hypothetical protein
MARQARRAVAFHKAKRDTAIGIVYMPTLARLTYAMAQGEAVADYVRALRRRARTKSRSCSAMCFPIA